MSSTIEPPELAISSSLTGPLPPLFLHCNQSMHAPTTTTNGAHAAAGSAETLGLGSIDPANVTLPASRQPSSQDLRPPNATDNVFAAPPNSESIQLPQSNTPNAIEPEAFHGQPVAQTFEIVAETISSGTEQAPEQLIVHRASDQWPELQPVAPPSTAPDQQIPAIPPLPPSTSNHAVNTVPRQLEALVESIAKQSTAFHEPLPEAHDPPPYSVHDATSSAPVYMATAAGQNVTTGTSENVSAAANYPFVPPQLDVAIDIEHLQADLPSNQHVANDSASLSAPSTYSMELSVRGVVYLDNPDLDADSPRSTRKMMPTQRLEILTLRDREYITMQRGGTRANQGINSPSTGSVTSSIYHFVEEFGRTFHRYKEGRYFMPNDEEEQTRLGELP